MEGAHGGVTVTHEDVKKLETALQSSKSAHHRLDRLETEVSDLQKLTETVAVLASHVSGMQTDVAEMKQDVKALGRVPTDRWNAVVGYTLAALISGIIGVMIGVVFK